uniref:Uncharacterized protein n=1 Tax=Timema bartmani TaxID=61472 RepID=A0A7R9FCB5_9NEOP|nr:unnamed protein product [Timema bartmani]
MIDLVTLAADYVACIILYCIVLYLVSVAEEYTKITTPRQDVLFKKGYLGRKRPTPAVDPASTPGSEAGTGPTSGADVVNGNPRADGEPLDSETSYEVLGPDDPPQFIYTNGFVDQNGLYFINARCLVLTVLVVVSSSTLSVLTVLVVVSSSTWSVLTVLVVVSSSTWSVPIDAYVPGGSYELYDPYSGNVTVVVGPAPPYPGGGGPPPVLAAVPCNPLPLQPLEWFNPAFLSCVAAPCQPQCMEPPRGKRYSLDSQNCSPQSSESTGSPQEGEEAPMQFHPQAPPPYVYPGYMFGPPVYNMNGEYRQVAGGHACTCIYGPVFEKEAPVLVSRSFDSTEDQFPGSSPRSIQRPTFVRITVTSRASHVLATSPSNDSKQPHWTL